MGSGIPLLKRYSYVANSCNMGSRGLPDIYTQSMKAKGVHIRQTAGAHVTTITYCLVLDRAHQPAYSCNAKHTITTITKDEHFTQ